RRVVDVVPDPTKDWTAVTLAEWLPGPSPARALAQRVRALGADAPDGKTAGAIRARLEEFWVALEGDFAESMAFSRAHLEPEVLEATNTFGGSSKLGPWLHAVSDALRAAGQAVDGAFGPGGRDKRTKALADQIATLAKRPS